MKEDIVKVLSKVNEFILGEGKEEKIKFSLISLICQKHLLIEDIPGVGKTSLVKIISKLFNLSFSRIQFTNDLLPADILGGLVYKKSSESFEIRKGPIFSNLILADELNRASPKTQSALLEVMEEGVVTLEGHRLPLKEPFIVMATQNPFGQIGTFPLPESQMDRFLLVCHLACLMKQAKKDNHHARLGY